MSNIMFGRKMKILGIVIGVVGIILSLIFAIGLFVTSSSPFMYGSQKAFYITYGICVLVIGSLATLVCAFRLYGQGVQLESIKAIEMKYLNSEVSRSSNNHKSSFSSNYNLQSKENENVNVKVKFCQHCGAKMTGAISYCPSCGNKV